jgi:RNA polymerase sigma-70 factor (ECF subfamily)
MIGEMSDYRLLRRLREGERDAAASLYLRYARRLTQLTRKQLSSGLASRVDPDDVVQSVFRTFFRRFERGDYDIPEGEELWKLLLVISLNKVRALGAYHRAGKRDISATVRIADQKQPSASAGEDQEFQALRLTIAELLAELPPPQPEVITLRIEGHEVADIARRTGRSKRTIERVLQSFRQRLAAVIHEDHPDLNADQPAQS